MRTLNESIKMNSELTQMIEFMNKDFAVIITVFLMFTKWSRDMEDIKRSNGTLRSERYNTWDEIYTGWNWHRLEIAGKKSNKLDTIVTETIQTKTEKKYFLNEKKKIIFLADCETNTNPLLHMYNWNPQGGREKCFK